MIITVDIHHAKAQLSELLDHAHAGEEVIIAVSGKPCAKLLPLRDGAERRPDIASGTVTDAFFEPLDPEETFANE
jgi:prevent-host-death family protein